MVPHGAQPEEGLSEDATKLLQHMRKFPNCLTLKWGENFEAVAEELVEAGLAVREESERIRFPQYRLKTAEDTDAE